MFGTNRMTTLCLLQLYLCPKIVMEVTSVISDLEPLLETEKSIINVLEEIIRKKTKALQFIQKEIQRYKTEHRKAESGVRYYLGNPINSLTLLKRLTLDIDYIESVISANSKGLPKNSSLVYPTKQDLDEAVLGVHRLQLVYKLNTTQLADGILKSTISLPMTAFDCYDIGQMMCKSKLLCKQGVLWLREAYRTFGRSILNLGLRVIDVVWALSNGYNRIDDSENYIEWTEKLKALKPKNIDLVDLEVYMDIHRVRLGKRIWHEEQKREKKKEKLKKLKVKLTRKSKIRKKPIIDPVEETERCKHNGISKGYKILCRGEMNVGSFIAKRLKCWYSSKTFFTKLAPIKTEQLYVKPDIFLYYGIIHDKEIERIKISVLPKLKVSQVLNSKGAAQPSSVNRISKNTIIDALPDDVQRLNQRLTDITGLNVSSAEPYHVNNYGVWGFYAQHLDYWEDPQRVEHHGNRLATVLIYMSEVQQGGATVFPALGLTVFPVKGAALYWTNLLPSGLGDRVTCHGACPVLRGSKWVATKWINSRYQELTKTCTTSFQSRLAKDIPYAEFKKKG